MAKCIDCKHSEWQLTPTGRIKQKVCGTCRMPRPEQPVYLCGGRHTDFHPKAIWPNYEGRCDAFEPKEAQ